MDTLTITSTHSDGIPGVDNDAHNPLARGLNRLLETGKPFERLLACYFDPLPLSIGIRWFGTFVFSAGGRVIYFPGLTAPQKLIQTSRGAGAFKQLQLEIDHFSLEAHRQGWHLTGYGKKRHLGTFRTTDLGDARVLWFGMSIASAGALRPVKCDTMIEASVPEADALRRLDVMLEAREGVVFNTLLFNVDGQPPVVPAFGHFSVIVGPCGFTPYTGDKLGFPFGSPFITPRLGDLTNVRLRTHRLSLEPHVDIDIITTILPGEVSAPVAITSA